MQGTAIVWIPACYPVASNPGPDAACPSLRNGSTAFLVSDCLGRGRLAPLHTSTMQSRNFILRYTRDRVSSLACLSIASLAMEPGSRTKRVGCITLTLITYDQVFTASASFIITGLRHSSPYLQVTGRCDEALWRVYRALIVRRPLVRYASAYFRVKLTSKLAAPCNTYSVLQGSTGLLRP
ncbi:hypothetical protein BDV25DRAFT_150975 [Aspergillus avenaceus]|uniref:Uncharacterized protein n=1 Tax=Aspergillus avenaceus TaxID=36643 RepID=A0A5N6U263_ASPAV|nr:hypothetical protein BDV25DRAFT_150975 [Aspergillus avenaceus]